jgi:deoxyribonuclease V
MKLAVSHPWDLPIKEAMALQAALAERVIARTTFDPDTIETVAGIDVGFRGGEAEAAIVVLRFSDLEPVDCVRVSAPVRFPYVPGLLAFREGPGVLAAVDRLTIWPDVFIFDAQGLAHERRLGLAAHMGVILDWPSIGCAKSRLIGDHSEPGARAGDWVPLYNTGEQIGAVVRTRAGVRPLYVSIGHRVDLATAVDLVLRCTRGYRLPETTRYAHRVASGAEIPLARIERPGPRVCPEILRERSEGPGVGACPKVPPEQSEGPGEGDP